MGIDGPSWSRGQEYLPVCTALFESSLLATSTSQFTDSLSNERHNLVPAVRQASIWRLLSKSVGPSFGLVIGVNRQTPSFTAVHRNHSPWTVAGT